MIPCTSSPRRYPINSTIDVPLSAPPRIITGSTAYNLPRPNLIGRTVVIIPRPQTEATRITLIGHPHLLTCPPPIAASNGNAYR